MLAGNRNRNIIELMKLPWQKSTCILALGALIFLTGSVFFLGADDKETGNFLLQIAILQAIIAVGAETLHEMKAATKETTTVIADSSRGQIEKLDNVTSALMDVSKSLQDMVADIKERKGSAPVLYACFGPETQKTEIILNSGNESIVTVIVGNRGGINSPNASWMIFFPPDIEIVQKGVFEIIKQPHTSPYPGYTSISFDVKSMGFVHMSHEIKIKTEAASNGERTIPFIATCDNAPRQEGSLKITLVG